MGCRAHVVLLREDVQAKGSVYVFAGAGVETRRTQTTALFTAPTTFGVASSQRRIRTADVLLQAKVLLPFLSSLGWFRVALFRKAVVFSASVPVSEVPGSTEPMIATAAFRLQTLPEGKWGGVSTAVPELRDIEDGVRHGGCIPRALLPSMPDGGLLKVITAHS